MFSRAFGVPPWEGGMAQAVHSWERVTPRLWGTGVRSPGKRSHAGCGSLGHSLEASLCSRQVTEWEEEEQAPLPHFSTISSKPPKRDTANAGCPEAICFTKCKPPSLSSVLLWAVKTATSTCKNNDWERGHSASNDVYVASWLPPWLDKCSHFRGDKRQAFAISEWSVFVLGLNGIIKLPN